MAFMASMVASKLSTLLIITRVFLDFIFDEFDIYWEKLSNDDIKW